MSIQQAVERNVLDVAYAQAARVADIGVAGHGHALRLANASGPYAARDLADAVHLLCSLYGRHPGLVELALGQCAVGAVREWLVTASAAFERERLYLVRLTAAVEGPAAERALAFGGEQLLLQNRGLFDLLEARAEARGDS